MKLLTFNFFFALTIIAITSSDTINIPKDGELETFMCASQPLQEDTVLILSTNVTHIIKHESLCLINMTYSLTLTSDSSLPAIIYCNGSKTQPNSGFSFINTQNLTLQRLVLRNCGGYLRRLDAINSIAFPFYFTEYHSAALVFLHIGSLLIKEVRIVSYYGFAVLAINPTNALMDSMNVTMASTIYIQNHGHSIGCGALLIFTDHIKSTSIVTSLKATINNSIFYMNYDFLKTIDCLDNLHDYVRYPIPIVNAAGLTIIYTQKTIPASVSVSRTLFRRNVGTVAGAMLVLHYKSTLGLSSTLINNITIRENFNLHKCHGSGLSLLIMPSQASSSKFKNTMIIKNSAFARHSILNSAKYVVINKCCGAGAFYIGVLEPFFENNITIAISNVQFYFNSISTTGSCIYANTQYRSNNDQFKVLNVILDSVTAYENSQSNTNSKLAKTGHFTFNSLKGLFITGSTYIYDNFGAAFDIINTKVALSGNFHCYRNTGERGPGFSLHSNSYFQLQNGLRAVFSNNSALDKGGAIYSFDDSFNQCTFQIANKKSQANISLIFINNSAGEAGSSIFSTNLYYCSQSHTIMTKTAAERLYRAIFKFNSSSSSSLSTQSVKRCICKDNATFECRYFSYPKVVYPGHKIKLAMTAKDPTGRMVHSMVSVELGTMKRFEGDIKFVSISSWYVAPSDTQQVLLESQKCTVVGIRLNKMANSPNPPGAVLVVSSPQDTVLLKVRLKLVDCPLGFELNPNSRTCNCSSVIGKGISGYHPVCHISPDSVPTITLPKSSTYWIGLLTLSDGTVALGVASTCHAYCNLNTDFTVFIMSSSSSIIRIADPTDISNSVPLCNANRKGPLCSDCALGYSATFGSVDCKQCSNLWLLTIVIYAVAGPLLIYLLYALNLTLTTGMINGIIFYAQINIILSGLKLSTTEHDVLSALFSISKGLISLINLSLNFNYPICLYNGMTHLMKSGLNLIFPVYLLVIVVCLIIASRYSVRLSNRISHSSVQVLVTVVHLSSARMFTSIMDVFTSIHVFTNATSEPMQVWLNDGTVEYGKGRHFVLMIITSLVVGPILVAYMTLILAGRPLQRSNRLREYIRPIYEAIHAPYKRNKEFFFAARILLVIFFYALYAGFRGNGMYRAFAIGIPFFAFYAALEALSRPFTKMSLNVFSFFQMVPLILICGTIWFFTIENLLKRMAILFVVTNTIIIVYLLAVIVLRVLKRLGLLQKLEYLYFKRMMPVSVRRKNLKKGKEFSGSFFEECNDTREPLLSPSY
uniref:Uncharacterized protein n=1 Tax=Amphimedon queenslandica TaxID=400682 RepID=A0A1X7VPK2_AMPQE